MDKITVAKAPPEDFSPARLKPTDGIACYGQTEYGRGLTVRVGVRDQGAVHTPASLLPPEVAEEWRRQGDLPLVVMAGSDELADRGRAERLQHVVAAIARYLNTSGSWQELQPVLDKLQQLVPFSLIFPGWDLISSHQPALGPPIHLWLKRDTDQVVRWEEGALVEQTDLAQLEREWELADDEE